MENEAQDPQELVKELFRAVIRDDVESVKRIHESGIDVLVVRNSAQQTPLQLARERGRKEVKAFLESGVRSNRTAGTLGTAGTAAKPKAEPKAEPTPDDKVQDLFRAVMKDDAAQAALACRGLDQCEASMSMSMSEVLRPEASLDADGALEAMRKFNFVESSRVGRQAPPPPSQARQIRGLLPVGALDAEKLSIRDLCDGQLLCALVISVRPDVLPKANPVALGRIAQFLKACTALGVNKVSLFSPPDLTPEPSNPNAVLRCLQALAATLQASQSWTGPRLEGLPGRR
ncbi:unnamed protein product [Effrenium voratum]|nr:unnamed protein product [Effrenium voratum]